MTYWEKVREVEMAHDWEEVSANRFPGRATFVERCKLCGLHKIESLSNRGNEIEWRDADYVPLTLHDLESRPRCKPAMAEGKP